MTLPSAIDVWLARELAQLTGRHPLFDVCLQSGIHHYILGGFWFGATLFAYWTMTSVRNDRKHRTRLLTTLAGSLVAIAFALLSRHITSWPPPRQSSELFWVFPRYIEQNWSLSSFPSDSTTLYASIAAGIFSIDRRIGATLWAAVMLLVALPRMYLGGHYLADVLAGMVLGIIGFLSARALIEPLLARHVEPIFKETGARAAVANLVIFFLVLQVAIEFRDGLWLWNSLALVRETVTRWPHELR